MSDDIELECEDTGQTTGKASFDKQSFIKELDQVEEDHIYRQKFQPSSGRD